MKLFFQDDSNDFLDSKQFSFARYKQILERDWKHLILINLLTLLFLIPFALGVTYAIFSSSVLILIPVCILGGIIASPGISTMYDAILRSLRDNLDDWWHNYKKAFKQNFVSSLFPSICLCLFLRFIAFTCALLWWSQLPPTTGTIVILTTSIILCTIIFSIWWPQIVLFNQRPNIQLKNCILFFIRYFWRTLGVAILQVLWWLLIVLFFPWSGFIMPFLGIWYILFLSCFFLYEQLNNAFKIEEQLRKTFPEQFILDEE